MTKIYFETFGCAANIADSEQMKGLLKEAEFIITDIEEEADIIIINSCTVKGPTESKIQKRFEELKDGYKIIILAGCIAQSDPKKYPEYPLIGTKQIHKVVEVVEEALNNNIVRAINVKEMPPLNLPLVRRNPVIEIIPINRGCLGFCSFCKTKSARGNLISYPIDQIVKRAQKAIQEGIKEIWLTSQDTGCYGFDINTNLPSLLNELVKIPGDYKIRVGMMNPDHLIKIQDPLIKIYQHPKIFKFLHLPIQAGNNRVLELMKRQYEVQNFLKQVQTFRLAIPEISIMTDIIVGFPTETPEEFFDTQTCLRKTSPDYTNVSKFWARPNTSAERIKDKVEGSEIKRRSQIITEISQNISRLKHEKWLGWEGNIHLTKKGKEADQWIGFTLSYNQVVVNGEYKLGQKIRVKVVKTRIFSLVGEEI
ncbi:hypothetical protein CL619_05140 [archaeon]|nr:hypothetical protein [archaeon]|tara:strand:- start:963 stop:2231 length:1269 start_codon:yes stop_codon:yes gene_type:complete